MTEQAPRGLTDGEAEELWRMTRHDYINPMKWPHLQRLLDELGRWADRTGRVPEVTR